MPPERNGPSINRPNAGEQAGFLGGADDNQPTEQYDDAPLKDVDVSEPEPLPAGDTFDRKDVEKLRRESAFSGERAKKFETMFEGYEPGAVDEWGQMISTFKQDPKSVAEQW